MKKDSHAETDGQKPAAPIAIVGIGCIFPKARNLQEYWTNLKEGVDAITDIPETHWNPDEYFHEDPKFPDRAYAKKGGFLPEIDFDPLAFGILPNALEATDTSQLLSLVAAQDALRDAGYLHREFDRDRISVIMGITGTQELVIPLGARLSHPLWRKALKDAGLDDEVTQDVVERISQSYVDWQESSFPGLLGNVVAGRIANKFDFGGTNCVVDAACASSMSAMHLAIMELQNGKADMVLTGGVDTFNHIFMYVCFSKTPALSPSGHARPFDRNSDGTTLGEGVGVMTLKRLEDAERDGDKIYAVIKGVGSSSDGGGTSIYAPTKDGQKKAYKNAYEYAGVTPETIELIEAHGTGTAVGDAMEIQGLTEAYGPSQTNGSWCALGSVKSQIGHAKAAAGVAGIIKSAMALYNKVLPPTIKVEKPAPSLEPGKTPFYVNTQKRPWASPKKHPRRAAVSSFGFGGSNFHCVLEEYAPRKEQIDWSGNTQILALCSDSLSGLKTALDALDPAESWDALRSKAARLRKDFDPRKIHRLLIVVEREQSSLEKLFKNARIMLENNKSKRSWSTPDGIFYGQGDVPGKLGVIFPGQGSQYVDMLKDLGCQFPQFQDILESANQVFQAEDEQRRLSDLIYPQPSFSEEELQAKTSVLQSTQVAQPAIGAVSLAALKILESFGLKAESLAGHSFGELVALCAAKVLDTDTFFAMSKLRGQLMGQKGGDKGSMLAVQGDLAFVEQIIKEENIDLVIANKNSPQQTVLSGATSEVERAAKLIKARDVRCKQLNVAAAFHSSFVSDASGAFLDALRQIEVRPPQTPVYADSSAELYPDNLDDIRRLLAGQLANPVDFIGIIENMYENGVRTFFEVGPSSQMNGLVKAILEGKEAEAFSLDASKGARSGEADLARALSQLSALGYALTLTDWDEGVPVEEEDASKPKKRKMTVALNGANYFKPKAAKPAAKRIVTAQVSENGSRANTSNMNMREEVKKLNVESKKLKIPAPQTAAVQNHPAVAQNQPVASQPAAPAVPTPAAVQQSSTPVKPVQPMNNAAVPEALRMTQENLRALQQFQQQTADLHRQFLEGQEATRQSFEMLFSQQQQLLLGNPQPQVQQAPFSPQAQVQQPVQATIQYETPAVPQVETVILQQEPQFVTEAVDTPKPPQQEEAPVQQDVIHAPQAAPESGIVEVKEILMAVVAEKTGYPEDMLDLDMGLDADLGIDSIKRVEILSALQEQLPQAPEISSDQIGSIQNLRQIVELLGSAAAAPIQEAPSTDAGADSGEVEKVLLGVVSEKTGYPEDMLDLDMGLDADLGIDSIKRVEILSALQSLLPGAPEISSDQIGQIQNLRQIVDFLGVSVVTPPKRHSGGEKSSSQSVDSNQVRTVLLQVVSEKTGYPEDMLDLDMGLDADLGIDSIKRVEILSALQSQLPEAPEINSDQIGQIQSLQQIVDFLSAGVRPVQHQASAAPATASVSAPAQSAAQVERTLLQVVAEKTGYPEDMLDLDMGLDADLGIDSIKRVEILSALQGQLPDAPEINSEQIGQIQNLRQIVEFLSASAEKKTPELAEKPAQSALEEVSEDSMLSLERSLPVPRKIPESLVRTAIQLPQGSTICLAAEPGDLCDALTSGLQARGFQVQQSSWDEAKFLDLPETMGGLMLLAPEAENTTTHFPLEAFRLLQTAGEALKKNPSIFVTVSRLDGQFGFGELKPAGSVISGGLAGLTKTVAREWPELSCKAIDFAPNFDDPHAAAEVILDEAFLSGPVEVGISPQGRITLRLERSTLDVAETRRPLNPGDLMLVSGGARGVTAECALSLAKAFQPSIALIGRSPLPEAEPEWLAGLEKDADIKKAIMTHAGRKMPPKEVNQAFKRLLSNREISQNIARIEAAGSRVLYRSVDVRDAEAMQVMVGELQQECGPVCGLIHGAGVLADRKIEDKTPEQLDRVYGTKVEGLLNLLNALQDAPLKVLSVFSSTTARFGRIGQVDYAIANEVLNKLTQQYARKHSDCRAISVNWGPWAGGMVTAAHERIFKKEGIEVIPLRAGADYLVQELSLAPGNSVPREVVILGAGTQLEEAIVDAPVEEVSDEKEASNKTQMSLAFERVVDVETHPFLKSHVIGGRAVLPMAMTIEWMAHASLHGNPGLAFQGFDDLRILKGVILKEGEGVKVQVLVGEARKEGKSFLVPVELHSLAEDGKRIRHSSAEFVLGGKLPQGERLVPEMELAPVSYSNSDIYQKFLFHGPDFHGIQSVEGCSPQGIAVAVKAAPSPSEWLTKPLRNHWLSDPLMVDCAFQMLILWSFENHQAGSLPTFVRNYRQFKAKFPKEGGRIVAQVLENEQNRALSSIEFLSPDGTPIARMEDYECTIDPSLNQAFRENRLA